MEILERGGNAGERRRGGDKTIPDGPRTRFIELLWREENLTAIK